MPYDCRPPDRSFLLPARYELLQGGWIVGGPDVVLEVVSPRDTSRAKLPFYFDVGVTEVVLVDRETRAVEVLVRDAADFRPVAPDVDGWVRCATLDTELRSEPDPAGGTPLLHVRRVADPARALRLGE